MININSWFFFLNPVVSDVLKEDKLKFDTTDYQILAKELTDLSFKNEVDKFNNNNCSSEEEKGNVVKHLIETMNLDILNYFGDKEKESLNRLLNDYLFPLSTKKPIIDFNGIIELLQIINKDERFFYIDTYSIFLLSKFFAYRKLYYQETEKLIPSHFTRKILVKKVKEANEIIQSKQINVNKNPGLEMFLFTDFMKKFVKTEEEKFQLDVSFTSETQSLKMILKKMPERIITNIEVINNTNFNFQRSSIKDQLLYQFLQFLYPEKKNYYSERNYPLTQKSEYLTFVRSTVTQQYYK
jgi:hypothetical protein